MSKLMVICEQMSLADVVLHKLEIIDPYCILAGGAPRDWYLGKAANDLDFYLHVPNNETFSAFELRLLNLGFTFRKDFQPFKVKPEEDSNYKMMSGVKHVYSLLGFDMPIQIVRMKNPTFSGVVRDFGTSVCMAWYKGGNKVRTTSIFEFSHKHKIIFYKEDYNAKVKHLNKMVAKFPTYTLMPFSALVNMEV